MKRLHYLGALLVILAGLAVISAQENVSQPPPVNVSQLAGSSLYADSCLVNTPAVAQISLTANGKIISGTSGKQTYICGLWYVTATAQNIALVEGTGTACGTGTAAMSGGSTPATGQNWAANSGFVGFAGGTWWDKTATTTDDVCLLVSGSGQVSGHAKYVQQ